MANRKEPKRPKRKRQSPASDGLRAAQRTLASIIGRADPEAAERAKR